MTNPESESLEIQDNSSLVPTRTPGSTSFEHTDESTTHIRSSLKHDEGYQPVSSSAETEASSITAVSPEGASRSIFVWLPEAFCLIIAIAALIAVGVTLGEFNDREQPDWSGAAMLNLSAVVALLATILRIMVAQVLEAIIGQLKWHWFGQTRPLAHLQNFNEAGQGVWGSIKFLFRIRRTDWSFLSAILMIFSVGIGTFTQQALRTTACSKVVPHAKALIPTARSYTRNSSSVDGDQAKPNLNVYMRAAIANGLTGLQSMSPVSAYCDTGNCSFPAYNGVTHSTLGLETLCLDISPFLVQTFDSIQDTQENGTDWKWTNYSLIIVDDANSDAGYFEIPKNYLAYLYFDAVDEYGDSLEYEFDYKFKRWEPSSSFVIDPVARLVSSTYDRLGLSAEEYAMQYDSLLSAIVIAPTLNPCQERSAYPQQHDEYSQPAPLPLVETSSCPQLGMKNVTSFPGYFSLLAAECFIYPSIRHYAGSVVNNNLDERLVGEPALLKLADIDDDANSDILYFTFMDPCFVGGEIYTTSNMTDVPGDRITLRAENSYQNYSEITGPKYCLYSLDSSATDALSDGIRYSVFDLQQGDCSPSDDYTETSCSFRWWLEPLSNGGNATIESITSVLNRMTDSITNQLRMNGSDYDGNPSNVTGMAYQMAICTQFRWQWLIFPAAVVFATLGLLVITAWLQWRDAHLPAWKASVLPILFYGLEDETRLMQAVPNKDLVKAADEVKAKLSFGNDGLRFHSVQ